MAEAKEIVTCRLDSQMKADLDEVAAHLNRDHSWVIADALRAYLEVYHLQVDHIRKALAGADRGEFATEEEVRAAFEDR
jgi:predicted transcriptional regulator